MTDTRFMHVTVYCPSCGLKVDLGAYEATLDLDLDYMSLQGGFRGAHRCSPPPPTFVYNLGAPLGEAEARRIRDYLRGRK